MDVTLSEKIRRLRLERGFTQEKVASHLGVTRQTYMAIENGQRDLKHTEVRKLADLFGVSVGDIMNEKPQEPEISVSLPVSPLKKVKQSLRINVPQRNLSKFKEVLLYVLSEVGAQPHVGETVVYKLLYFIDFDYYEKFEEQLIGATYLKNRFGPTPIEFRKIVDRMIRNQEIESAQSKHFRYEQKKYLPLREPNLDLLSGRELKHIDEVLAKLGGKNATELSEYSHDDVPWMVADEGKPIEYEAVFYRTPKTSVRNYSSLEK